MVIMKNIIKFSYQDLGLYGVQGMHFYRGSMHFSNTKKNCENH
jgi:hypothetical protein